MSEDLHSELKWPPSDILVGYDPDYHYVWFSKLSTGEPLKVWDCQNEREVTEEALRDWRAGRLVKPGERKK